MNKILSVLGFLSFGLYSAAVLQDGSIRIGDFTYKTKKSKVFLKDHAYDCDWFSLYAPSGEHQAGLLVEARRNDTLFVSGTYQIESNRFTVKNYYHYRQRHEPDSAVTVFVQNASGGLQLSSIIEYTGGMAKTIR